MALRCEVSNSQPNLSLCSVVGTEVRGLLKKHLKGGLLIAEPRTTRTINGKECRSVCLENFTHYPKKPPRVPPFFWLQVCLVASITNVEKGNQLYGKYLLPIYHFPHYPFPRYLYRKENSAKRMRRKRAKIQEHQTIPAIN